MRPPSDVPAPVLARSLALVRQSMFQERSPLLRMGRFELRRTLGHGGMGVAYEAYDPLRRERVALKTLHALGPSGLFMLKREFRSLARLAHRNLVVLHDLFVSDDEAFFSMELIDGVDFVSYVREGVPPGAGPPEQRLLDGFVQLCEGVHAVHQAGKLHCDLKPSNVLVTPQGRVVLLDFGLVHDLDVAVAAVGGTPAYMAPEQRAGRLGTPCDYFAIGRILEAALRGGAALRRPRGTLGGRADHAWEELCARLTSPDPEARPGFEEILAAVRAPRAVARSRQRGRPIDLFVGRERELRMLEASFESSANGPVVVSLRGEAGIGKSTLVRCFLDRLARDGRALVLRGACHEHESIPYKALDSIVDALSQHLAGEDPIQLTADERTALVSLFPVLGRVASFAGLNVARGGDLSQRRSQAFTAFGRLLGQLASAGRLVLSIDDAQWSDTDSGQLLRTLLSGADAVPFMLVMIDRCDQAQDNPALSALQASANAADPRALVQLQLGPLDPRAVDTLAKHFSDLSGGDEVRAARLAAESRGNPLLLTALAAWSTRGPAWPNEAISLDAALGQRLSTVSDLGRTVLSLVALAGFPLGASVLANALALEAAPYAVLDELRAARLIHTREARDLVIEPDHGAVAEAVLRRIEAAERRALHLRLAHALERVDGVAPELLVEQYAGAECFDVAAQHARRAADAALVGLAFVSAAGLYRRAIALGSWDAAERVALHGSLARAIEHSGQRQDAIDAYLEAARLADDPNQALEFEGCAIDHLSAHGRFDDALTLLRRGYGTLGLPWPKTTFGVRLRVAMQLAGWLLRASLRLRPTRRGSHADRGRARIAYLSNVGRALENQSIERALYNALLCFDESERHDDPRFHARARGGRALVAAQLPFDSLMARSVRELAAACDAATQLGDAEGLVHLERQLATMHFLNGQTRLALHAAQRAEAQLRSMPRRPIDLDGVMTIAALALLDLGELTTLAQYLGAFEREAKLAPQGTRTWFELHPARFALMLAADEPGRMRAELRELARDGSLHTSLLTARWAHAVAQVELAIYEGDAEAAALELERRLPVLRALSWRPMDDSVRLLRARVALMVAARTSVPRARAQWLRRAARDAARLARRQGRMSWGPAQLLLAAVAALRERPERAKEHLAVAHARAKAADHKLFAAVVRVCDGLHRADDAGRASAQDALKVIQAAGVQNPQRWIASVACGFHGLLGHADA